MVDKHDTKCFYISVESEENFKNLNQVCKIEFIYLFNCFYLITFIDLSIGLLHIKSK